MEKELFDRTWEGFFDFMKRIEVPEDFLADRKDLPPQKRELIEVG